jgi:anti-anti-sigma regulatory factor
MAIGRTRTKPLGGRAGDAQLSIVTRAAEIRRTFELTGLDREFALQPSLTSGPNGETG